MKINGFQTRRHFIKTMTQASAACALLPALGSSIARTTPQQSSKSKLTEARYYEKLPNRKIKCVLCPRECVIDDQETGYCGVRENHGGTYYTLVYGRPCSANVDPIEKKPLFHFLPGTLAFSIATVGCNVLCKFCQNWQISQARPDQVPSYELSPQAIAQYARDTQSRSIAYTYTEPVIFTEYMYDCAEQGHRLNIKSVMISNGYIKAQPMKDLSRVLDAVKIDLKAYTEKFYQEMVSGHLQPVLDTLVLLKQENMWTEIVYLMIPTLNDNPKELQQMCQWIVKELGPDVPIHFTRFHPEYRLKNLPPTPLKTLEMARKIALDTGLNFCYIGNVPGHEGENTYCPGCKKMVIQRLGFQIVSNSITKQGQCKHCGHKIPGIWS
ncbi:MAG: AmmeMemoRadiSam system radical SAM enzyme [candidate division KSB1 bacterium]|nr:AmmeMemoRadiSam system radical SAM enzyme [candidate division KSB1 bacterium]MDZ7334870.1 AmmeMemoRadiSam system radical SAM enzyme [candidate division KSB1 bacterium]MDZ7357352.1 AmmeMemoRadiSam system radical SAM enzyme [candidate division KSB1 bacterium]MDZ7399325.1 AmmeMemoRadiSam system radical SAM enzyme [candidate division KSB1 bacterium]